MKSFKGFSEMMTTGDAGIPQDTANMNPKGKRALVTRRYIEVNGKRKLQCKESSEKKEACWDSHKQVGMKKKGGKTVPNCVPKEEVQHIEEGMLNDIRDFIVAVGAAIPTKKNKKARADKTLEDQIRSAMQADPEFDKLVRNVVHIRKDGVAAFKKGGNDVLRKYVAKTVDSATAKKLGTLQTRWMKVKKDGTVSKAYSNTFGKKFKDEKDDPTKHRNVEDMYVTHLVTAEKIGKIIKQVALRANQKNESVEEGRYPTWNKARVALNKDKKSGKKKDYKILSPAEFMKAKPKKESVEFNESISDLMEANLPINMLVGPGGVGGGKTYQQAGKEMMKDAWRALTGKQKRVIAKVHKLTQTDDELAKLYRDGWKGGGNSMKPGARKAFDARVKELLPNEQTRDYVAAWKSVRDKVKSAMKESVEHLEEKTFHANIGNKDYQKIRSASMRGNFNHKFSRKTNGDVAFNTKNPVTLTKDLEKLIDSGASSWSDILDIYGVHKKSKSVWPGQYAGGGAFQVKNK